MTSSDFVGLLVSTTGKREINLRNSKFAVKIRVPPLQIGTTLRTFQFKLLSVTSMNHVINLWLLLKQTT